MTTFGDALKVVLARAAPLTVVDIPILNAAGLVLAETVKAQVDSPRFDNSAVDGFAVYSEDATQPATSLRIQAEIQAGSSAEISLDRASAVRIFTGARMPGGADAVVMQEDCRWSSDQVTVLVPPKAGQHIRHKGEDFEKGRLLFEGGTHVTPAVVGVLAMNGLSGCRVHRTPHVAVIPTGNELAALGEALKPGEIYESNGPALRAAVQSLGFECDLLPPAIDNLDQIEDCLRRAFEEHDVVITCGGVSVGAYDHVSEACARVGVQMEVAGVAIRPGKPFHFGHLGEKLFFGLPGNPVSALVTFTLFAKPALLKLAGVEFAADTFTAALAAPLQNSSDRDDFVPALFHGTEVVPLEKRGSHLLGGLAKANCLVHLPAKAGIIQKGASVECVRLWK